MGPGMFDDFAKIIVFLIVVGSIVVFALGVGATYLSHYVANHLVIQWLN